MVDKTILTDWRASLLISPPCCFQRNARAEAINTAHLDESPSHHAMGLKKVPSCGAIGTGGWIWPIWFEQGKGRGYLNSLPGRASDMAV